MEEPQADEVWQEVLRALSEIKAELRFHGAVLHTLVAQRATPGQERSVDAMEESSEALGTWLLTDEKVEQIERAIVEEQRVRGKAYGG